MPRVAFSPDNKRTRGDNYPKLKLDKDEVARVVVIEEPLAEFVHTLESPVVDEGTGALKMETRKRKDGTTYDVPATSFVGRHICNGDFDVVNDKGIDVEGCVVCVASTKTNYIAPPERRFAVHVLKYATKPGSTQLQDPFSVQVVAWSLSEGRFNKLADLAEQWGDLRKLDLQLGPCENKDFQNYDIAVIPGKDGGGAEYLRSKETKKFAATAIRENRSDDLSAVIARQVTNELAQEDVNTVLTAVRASQDGAPSDVSGPEQVAVEDLQSLLEGPAEDAPDDEPEEETPFEDEDDLPEPEADDTDDDDDAEEDEDGEIVDLADLLG